MEAKSGFNNRGKSLLLGLLLPCLIVGGLFVAPRSRAELTDDNSNKQTFPADVPAQIDVRGGTPRGLDARSLTPVQIKALNSLQGVLGATLNVRYNGLTATPMSISNPSGYLTKPSTDLPETIARDFARQNREIYRFDEDDLSNLKLQSRAETPEGTTILLFNQQKNGLPVYHGEVLVNVAKSGQIISAGGDSFPRLNVVNSSLISASDAVQAAANSLGINGYAAQSLGAAQILNTYGNLPPEYATGEKIAKGAAFSDDVIVQKIVFPLGDEGRLAYKFNTVTAQFRSIMWQNIVDAQTGAVLRRISLTSYLGETGGGTSIPRRATFRPDIQNTVESNGAAGGAQGKVFDTQPVTMSKVGGVGRAVRSGTYPNYTVTAPTYDAEAVLTNHYRYSLVAARNENPLPFTLTSTPQALTPGIFGQVTRGFPDAATPSVGSPFGWFYLPTGSGGAEITAANSSRAITKVAGYTMAAEAQSRNLTVNSPNGDGAQPFSADLTTLAAPVTLADGRVLNSVFQSRYAEGNNVTVSDDRANDNDATRGVRGYSANRQFTDSRFDYYGEYEFGGVNASGGGTGSTTPVSYPASSNPDVYPDTVSLFNFNNVEHDYLYSIGFTEQLWNFQFDNFGKGGAAGDGIVAEVQDGSGTDNANMSTPAEGTSPRMQMYLFTDPGFRRSDGDLDWDVVAHEHYHGVSNRSAAKGADSCLGTPLVGESGGMGEGWSDTIASSMSDDESEGEYVTGQFDKAIRRLPYSNYRWSYGAINGRTLNVRKNTNLDVAAPDDNAQGVPYEVHDIGEVWAAALWDMRELMIVKQKINGQFPGVFFDANRLGGGAAFYVGERQLNSADTNHPINYRAAFGDSVAGTTSPQNTTIKAASHIVRPGLLAAENANYPARNGPLATAVGNGGRLADKIVLRGLQLAPCNPTFVDMRDSMLAADREVTGGENVAIIWRAFASHGVGVNATSTGKTNGTGQQGSVAAVVEDFTAPTTVTDCETGGPSAAPTFTLVNTQPNQVDVTITPVTNATVYVVQRSTNPTDGFATIATLTSGTTYSDTNNGAGLTKGQTYYYQIHAGRNADCIGAANTQNITVTVGAALSPAPVFAGLTQVDDTRAGSSLRLSWSAATSTNAGANIVYDIFRVINVDNSDLSVTPATFTPSAANRVAQNVSGTNYTDSSLTLGQQYYYIVQARDTTNGKIDTLNVGNTITKFNAPSTNTVSSTPFAPENFETTAAGARFTPNLIESATPNRATAAFQRTTADIAGGGTNSLPRLNALDATTAATGLMFAPDFDPTNNNPTASGAASDFYTTINPTNLTRASFLEFDHRFGFEATFDGAAVEIVLGDPTLPVTPSPNNATTFDLDDYILQNGYNGNLNGKTNGVQTSPLMGRRGFTGTRNLSHVKIALGDFAPGAVKNPNSLPVYIRFHTVSDVGTFVDGWYIDNVAVNNFNVPTAAPAPVKGRVVGNNNLGIADAQLVLTDLQTGATFAASTNRKGNFAFAPVAVGDNYRIAVTRAGYVFKQANRLFAHSGEEFITFNGTATKNNGAGGGERLNAPTSANERGDNQQ